MIKVTVNSKGAFRKLNKLQKELTLDKIADTTREEVLRSISSGVSPVAKSGRYERYSESYRNAIKKQYRRLRGKKRSPVNLKVSGNMLKSIFVKVSKQAKRITLGFKSEIAGYHDNGVKENSLPQRKMLPSRRGERFNGVIQNEILDAVNTAIADIIRKLR